ncbi:MAG TPA: YicC family protein [Spirochaetota bacterium]|nr:YicC family protein [Spirochaetota bacterium]HNT12022.1 YicC family protein [Spirochaetota bacterium]
MESMTGYASLERTTDQFSYAISLKTLNSKYVEVYVNVPKVLKDHENEFAQLLKKHFARGKIELSIEFFDWVDSRPSSIDSRQLGNYFRELQKINHTLKADIPVTYDVLLTLDGVMRRKKTTVSEQSLRDIRRSLDAVVKKTMAMRLKEGAATAKNVLASVSVIVDTLKKIRLLAKDVSRAQFERLRKSISDLTGGAADTNRLYAEVAILSDKLDINEEISRLDDHIAKFRQTVKSGGQVGRTLDFLSQEMFREINTIASKANSSTVSHHAVEVKNHIDKIREQCRNIV